MNEASSLKSKFLHASFNAPLTQPCRLPLNLDPYQFIGIQTNIPSSFGRGFKKIPVAGHGIDNALLAMMHRKSR
jgi:hypothetical protein